MPILIAGCVDPVLIFSFVGGVVVSIFAGLVAWFWRFKNLRNQAIASWISIAGGAVVFVIAGRDGPVDGFFCIPLGFGILSLFRGGQQPQQVSMISNASLEEIQQEIAEEIESWERIPNEPPSLDWLPGILELEREFQSLAAEVPLDAVRIQDFKHRLRQHITSLRLKGFDHMVWYAEALERLAEQEGP